MSSPFRCTMSQDMRGQIFGAQGTASAVVKAALHKAWEDFQDKDGRRALLADLIAIRQDPVDAGVSVNLTEQEWAILSTLEQELIGRGSYKSLIGRVAIKRLLDSLRQVQ